MRVFSISLCILSFAVSCKSVDLNTLSAVTPSGNIQCVIEIPAGTNVKIEYNKTTKKFEVDQRDGKDRIINFLPYPGNYGFIPSTYSDPKKGGDGDGLDVLVIAQSMPTGTVVEIRPVGVLKLIDDGESDYKIIGIPVEPELQIVTATTFAALSEKHPQLLKIIETWFLSYDIDPAKSEGWGDEAEARAAIVSSRWAEVKK